MRSTLAALLICALTIIACSEGEVPNNGDGPVVLEDARVADKPAPGEAKPKKDVELDRGVDRGPDAPLPDKQQPDQLQPDQLQPDTLAPDTGPPSNNKCLNAKMLQLVGGKASDKGDTTGFSDEFSKLTCGGSVALNGPQAYYMVLLSAGESYRVTLSPGFDAYFYIFSPMSVCTEASIQKDCSSQGSTGDASPQVSKGGSKSLIFTVLKTGYWYIAVDSNGAAKAGPFTLEIELDCSKFDNKCNNGINDKGVCKAQPKSGSCTDENLCTQNDKCVNKGGLGICEGTPKVCPGNTCNTGKCDTSNGLCVNVPKSGQCNDNDPCTLYDQCQAGVCTGTKMNCSSVSDTCNLGLCVNGACSKVPKSGSISCNDNNACTVNDVCKSGVCKGATKSCPGDQCNNGGCAVIAGTATCVKVYKKGFCNDGDLCTVKDTCVNNGGVGKCVGTKTTCNGDTCNNGVCDTKTGQCKKVYKAGSCNDSNNCTHSDKCVYSGGVGVCKGTTKSCAGDQCNTGLCNSSTGSCYKVYKSGSCNDSDSCTSGEYCLKSGSTGYCGGGKYTGDAWEPNTNCSQAKYIGTVKEGGTWPQVSATLSPPGDIDFFSAKGLEGNHTCVPWTNQYYYFKARVYVPSGRIFHVCVFKGSCSGAATCKTGSGTVEVQFTVKGTCAYTDDTWAYIRVYATDGKKGCEKYTVAFNYND